MKSPLWDIENIPPIIGSVKNIRNAPLFADRLLTLPLHSFVNSNHQQNIIEILKNINRDGPVYLNQLFSFLKWISSPCYATFCEGSELK